MLLCDGCACLQADCFDDSNVDGDILRCIATNLIFLLGEIIIHLGLGVMFVVRLIVIALVRGLDFLGYGGGGGR